MSFFHGKDGALKLGDKNVLKVRNWTLDVSTNMLDVTSLGDVANSFFPGLSSTTGTATVMYYHSAAAETDVTDLLTKIAKTGTNGVGTADLVSLTFQISSTQSISANAYINSASITSSTEELTSVSFNFTVTGQLTTVTVGTAAT